MTGTALEIQIADRRAVPFFVLFLFLLMLWPGGVARATSENFESPPVHPVALTPDGSRLLVAHTADHRLVVFALDQGPIPIRIASIQVGLEPVTVAARSNTEAWVVNHVSDSISRVDLVRGIVVQTLFVGDEPTDVVFSESASTAVVCLSSEARLALLDLDDLSAPPRSVWLDAIKPRSLALSPDGASVYVAALEGGNQTTAVSSDVVRVEYGLPPPIPPMNAWLPPAPWVGLILKHDGEAWRDELGRNWNRFAPYRVLDTDVTEVDISSGALLGVASGVGTHLFDVAVGPISGRLYVSNQEAINHERFERNVRGRFAQSRLSRVDPGSYRSVSRHLNEHIDYGSPDGDAWERSLSLSMPLDLAMSEDESRIYVAAFGSAKVAVLEPSGGVLSRIPVGGGPCGLALDEMRGRLYVFNRFESSLSLVDTATESVIATLPVGLDPTSAAQIAGRRFLYDAESTSAHGDLSCATCHLFGGMDGLAWDLGDPEGEVVFPDFAGLSGFHPMKGPMVTQSLKALEGTEPFHWRGDRRDLSEFNPAFVGLMGRTTELTAEEFALFQDFVFAMRYPPNPRRALDGNPLYPEDGSDPYAGEEVFTRPFTDGFASCDGCHELPTGESGHIFDAHLLGTTQDMDVPQLRNLGEKLGAEIEGGVTRRGFGYAHDGTSRDIVSFLEAPRFTLSPQDRADVAAFVLAFDTGVHAAVGAQLTLGPQGDVDGRMGTLLQAANAGAIGFVTKGLDAQDVRRGWVYLGGNQWASDRAVEGATSHNALVATASPARPLTFTAVLPGTQVRLGIDHDLDGYLDRDELDGGADPDDPLSWPNGSTDVAVSADGGPRLRFDPPAPNPAPHESRLRFALDRAGEIRLSVIDPSGRRVRELFAGSQPQGEVDLAWDLRDGAGAPVANGVYFVRLDAANGSATRRLVVRR